jgi:hypothetical protein
LVESVETWLVEVAAAVGAAVEGARAAGAVNASSELVRTNLGTGRPEAVAGVVPFCAKPIGRSHIHREAINNLMKG